MVAYQICWISLAYLSFSSELYYNILLQSHYLYHIWGKKKKNKETANAIQQTYNKKRKTTRANWFLHLFKTVLMNSRIGIICANKDKEVFYCWLILFTDCWYLLALMHSPTQPISMDYNGYLKKFWKAKTTRSGTINPGWKKGLKCKISI